MNQLILKRCGAGHDVVSRRLPIAGLRFDVEYEDKTKATTTGLYVSLMQSLYFLYAVWGYCVVNANSKIRYLGLKKLIPTHLNR